MPPGADGSITVKWKKIVMAEWLDRSYSLLRTRIVIGT